MIALVDCNNFYASCERVFNPSLNGKPVIVLSNNDGCVIARSNEAKLIGIQMGAIAHQIKDFIEKHHVQVFSSNYTLYGDMSNRVMTELGNFTPEIEVYSIDEAFLDFSGFELFNLHTYCQDIKRKVTQNTGIPISIGVAPTKTLAKIANRSAKKNPVYQGVCVLNNDIQIKEVLSKFPIEDVWGIGYRYAKMLQLHGCNTALDFANANEGFVKSKMGVVGLRMQRELNGFQCLDIETLSPPKQNICTSRSFGQMLTEKQDISQAVSTFASKCAYKLRKQNTATGVIIVFLNTNRFNERETQYNPSIVVKLPVSTNSSIELVKYALIGLNKIFKQGFKYKKAGVIVGEIIPETQIQIGLFDTVNRPKHNSTMTALDKLNGRYGREKVKVAACGDGRKWKLRSEHISRCYTTQWTKLIEIVV